MLEQQEHGVPLSHFSSSPTASQSSLEASPVNTEAGVDSPFHAMMGEWDETNKCYVCKNVVAQRKRAADKIRKITNSLHPLYPLLKSVIEALLMGGSEVRYEVQILRDNYNFYLEEIEERVNAIWASFEKELQKYPEVIQYLEKNVPAQARPTTLRQKFQFFLNTKERQLYGMILSRPELNEAFEAYKKTLNEGFFQTKLSIIDQPIIDEYANFIEQIDRELLPVELKLIAHALNIKVMFYTANNLENKKIARQDFNSEGVTSVAICFDDTNHYQRMVHRDNLLLSMAAASSVLGQKQQQPNEEKKREQKEEKLAPSTPEVSPLPVTSSMTTLIAKALKFISPIVFSRENGNVYRISASILLSLLNAVVNLGPPIIIAKTYESSGGEGFNPTDIDELAYVLIGAYGLVFMTGKMLPSFRDMLLHPVRANAQKQIADKIVEKCYEIPLDVHLSTPTGNFAQLISKTYQSVDKFISGFFGGVLPVTIEMSTAVGILTYFYGPVALTEIAVLFLYTLASARNAQLSKKTLEAKEGVLYPVYGEALSAISRYEVAHHFGNVHYEVGKIREGWKRAEVAFAQDFRQSDKNALSLAAINGLGFTAIILFSAYLFSKKDIKTLDYFVISYYLGLLIPTLTNMSTAVNEIYGAVIDSEKVSSFLAEPSQIGDRPNCSTLELSYPPMLEVKGINFSYDAKRPILQNINFRVKAGETVALVGFSGSGKSTIIKLLLRFYPLNGGVITIDNMDIAEYSAESLRHQMAVVPQQAALFNVSIKENIRYGYLKATDSEVEEAAKLAALEELMEEEDGLDTVVGERGDKLSGGQKQRVSIARAVLKDRPVYLLDEPTASLDVKSEQQVLETLNKITSGLSTIFVTHRLHTAQNADIILYMEKGKIVERGSYAQLSRNPYGKFFQQLRTQCEELGVEVPEVKSKPKKEERKRLTLYERRQNLTDEQGIRMRSPSFTLEVGGTVGSINSDTGSKRRTDSLREPLINGQQASEGGSKCSIS